MPIRRTMKITTIVEVILEDEQEFNTFDVIDTIEVSFNSSDSNHYRVVSTEIGHFELAY